ncbi:helix-turn-helix transcriptional regulator [Caldithrix abyssi]|nr:helix-turn-helix transcriptional regulator [Caldithrix abyssi]
MINLLKSLGKRIHTLRVLNKVTQEELENRTGLNAKYISSIERGQKNVTVNTLDKIADGLNVELYELFLFSDNLTPEKTAQTAIESLLKESDQKTLNLCLDFLKKATSS